MILVADASALIALAACESLNDYLLIDDKRGRKVARLNHIQTIGTMRVLLQAKRCGLIPKVAPLIEQIRSSPVFISESLIHTVLQIASET